MNHDIATPRSPKRLLALAGAGFLAVAALSGCSMLEEAASEESTDSTEVDAGAADAATEAAAGDCLTIDFTGASADEFSIPCEDPEAYWEITEISNDSGATTTDGTVLDDMQVVWDLCGEENSSYIPGELVTNWNMIYDETTGDVDTLYCTQAIDKEDAEGGTPYVVTEGECFNSAVAPTVLPCDAASVDSKVISVVELEVGEYAEADLETAAADCTGSSWYPLTDVNGYTSGVLCLE